MPGCTFEKEYFASKPVVEFRYRTPSARSSAVAPGSLVLYPETVPDMVIANGSCRHNARIRRGRMRADNTITICIQMLQTI